MIPSPVFFKDFVYILTTVFFSDQLSVAVSNKFSYLCHKSPKQKPVLSQWFVNYLQIHSHDYRELMNLKMREYNYSFVSRIHWPEDVSILASTDKPENTRMWGCEETNKVKVIWTEDLKMWGCKHTSQHTWSWGYEDVRIQASTHEPEDMRMQGCEERS